MNYKQIFAVREINENRIKRLFPEIGERSGIYVFTREENGFKYAYVGQAVNVLRRAAEHLAGYQHIDLSIKKHGLYDNDNPNGWKLQAYDIQIGGLDEYERVAIKMYADFGYQLRNETTGGQGEGKRSISDGVRGGYLKGKREGELKATREIGVLIDKYTTGLTSKGGAIADRKTAELLERLRTTEK
jgi:hypothetical protein